MPIFAQRNISDMKKIFIFAAIAGLLLAVSSCRSHYVLKGIERSRILIDQRYDASPDAEAMAFLAPYKHVVDSMMGPVVGETDHYMAAGRPEGELSNLLSDILIWGSKKFNETPDFAVYNIGGMRAALVKGKITYGDVLEVAPFENKLCLLTLSGEKVMELFEQIAMRGGEGVSHGVQLVITKDGRLKSARLNGKEIDPRASYRIATIDYVAQGNDRMEAFKAKTNLLSPQGKENNVRFFIMDYFREQQRQGKTVSAKLEGRIVME